MWSLVNADSTTNGGVTVHYEYGSGMSLATDDELLLEAGSFLWMPLDTMGGPFQPNWRIHEP